MRRTRQKFGAFLFTLPALALLVIFLVYPAILTFRMSLDTGAALRLTKFVGLANFQQLFGDRLFLDLRTWSGAIINNALWLILYVGSCLGIGLLVAALADRVSYERVVKTIFFAPLAIAATAAGVIWLLVYAPQANIGVLNGLLGAAGVDPVGWLGMRQTVNYAIIAAAVWAGTGLVVVILSAAIKAVPQELIEAAMIDGATAGESFRHITMPLITIPISVVVVTLAISVIKVFDIVYVMSHGGPNGASRVIGYTYYVQTFELGRGGPGAAAAVIMILITVPIMILNVRRFQGQDPDL